MILPFKQFFDKEKQKPTYFAEKINKAIMILENIDAYAWYEYAKFQYNIVKNKEIFFKCEPKIHTIREDAKNRWKSGVKIHAVYNNRQKNQFQFAPTFECKGIQYIGIYYCQFNSNYPIIYVTDKKEHLQAEDWLSDEKIKLLAKNDGFENLEEFYNYFNTDFEGKIIHFTNFRY